MDSVRVMVIEADQGEPQLIGELADPALKHQVLCALRLEQSDAIGGALERLGTGLATPRGGVE